MSALMSDLPLDGEQRGEAISAFKAFVASLEGENASAVVPQVDVSALPAVTLLIEAGYRGVGFGSLPATASSKDAFLTLFKYKIEASVDDYEVGD